MKNIISLLIIIAIGILLSCNNSDSDIITTRDFEKAREYYAITDASKWELRGSQLDGDNRDRGEETGYWGGIFYYQKVDADTTYRLSFRYYESINDTCFVPREYYKHFVENAYYQHVILYGENSDTLFYYRAEMFGSMIKVFRRGKYYYKYKYGELSLGESLYFEENSDSLTAIKGHNLPKLLELNDSLALIKVRDLTNLLDSFKLVRD